MEGAARHSRDMRKTLLLLPHTQQDQHYPHSGHQQQERQEEEEEENQEEEVFLHSCAVENRCGWRPRKTCRDLRYR